MARAGKAATGYALRVFPRTIDASTRRIKNQTNIYTYAQPTIKTLASNPGSKFGRQGGSDLDRRGQKVALANSINANMLHTWRRAAKGSAAPAARTEFVSLPLVNPVATAAAPIRIELRRGTTSVSVAWPTEAAEACAAWLRELLR